MFKVHEVTPKKNSTQAHTYINIPQFGKSSSLYFIKVEVELATTNILKTKQERETGGRGGGEHIYKNETLESAYEQYKFQSTQCIMGRFQHSS